MLAHHRTGAVTTNEVSAFDRNPISAIKIVGNCRDPLLVLADFIDFGAIENANARFLSYMSEKHWLEELLIDPVRMFRRWPSRVGTNCSSASRTSRWNQNA